MTVLDSKITVAHPGSLSPRIPGSGTYSYWLLSPCTPLLSALLRLSSRAFASASGDSLRAPAALLCIGRTLTGGRGARGAARYMYTKPVVGCVSLHADEHEENPVAGTGDRTALQEAKNATTRTCFDAFCRSFQVLQLEPMNSLRHYRWSRSNLYHCYCCSTPKT